MTPIPQQGRVATVPTTLGTAASPFFTVCPYLFHYGVLPHSRKGMGEVNQHHYLRSFPTIDGMISSTGDPTPMTSTELGKPPQKWPFLKDKMDRLQQGRGCNSSTQGNLPM